MSGIGEVNSKSQLFCLNNSYKNTQKILDKTSRTINLKYILALINSSFAARFFLTIRRSKRHIYPDDYKRFPVKIVPLNVQNELNSSVDKLLLLNVNIADIKSQLNNFQEAVEKFKSSSPRYSDIQLVCLADIPGLKHIQFEKRLGKPNIRREGVRVYHAKNHYLELATEQLAEYIELVLNSMQDNLRGLTKPDILRMVQVPKDDKVLHAILKYNSDLKKQQAKLEQQRDTIDREIDERVYELYGIENK